MGLKNLILIIKRKSLLKLKYIKNIKYFFLKKKNSLKKLLLQFNFNN